MKTNSFLSFLVAGTLLIACGTTTPQDGSKAPKNSNVAGKTGGARNADGPAGPGKAPVDQPANTPPNPQPGSWMAFTVNLPDSGIPLTGQFNSNGVAELTNFPSALPAHFTLATADGTASSFKTTLDTQCQDLDVYARSLLPQDTSSIEIGVMLLHKVQESPLVRVRLPIPPFLGPNFKMSLSVERAVVEAGYQGQTFHYLPFELPTELTAKLQTQADSLALQDLQVNNLEQMLQGEFGQGWHTNAAGSLVEGEISQDLLCDLDTQRTNVYFDMKGKTAYGSPYETTVIVNGLDVTGP